MRPANDNETRMLALTVEAGLHFLRMLERQPTSRNYRRAFTELFALQAIGPPSSAGATDPAALRFVRSMAGRALDARRLASALRSGTAAALAANPALNVDVGDRAEVAQTASAWLAWYDALTIEPESATNDAWLPERMEYAVSIAGRLSPKPEDEVTLSADEFDDGVLDWSSFDLNAEVNMGTAGDDRVVAITETTVPSPLTFRGTPAPRFWELEDGLIDYGLTPVGPTDLAHLMMIEYANSYGNDWFVVPLTLPIGSLTRIDSLVVTDSFGVRTLLRPLGDRSLPQSNWAMWQMSYRRRPGEEPIKKPVSNTRSSSRCRALNRKGKAVKRSPQALTVVHGRRAIGCRRACPGIGFLCCRSRPEPRMARLSRGFAGVRCCSRTDRSACIAR